MAIDYEKLLKKYIKHVYKVEESMFLPSLPIASERKSLNKQSGQPGKFSLIG